MILGVPYFLYLIPVALFPLVFHMMLNRKREMHTFSTFMFFHRADPKMHSKRKVKEWLLLSMRILIILLMILTLARPAVNFMEGLTGNIALVIMIDNSASMAARSDGGLSKFEVATKSARKLVEELNDNSSVAIVLTVDDPTVAGLASMTSSKDKVFALIDQLRVSNGSGNVAAAFSKAGRILFKAGESMEKGMALYAFSDLQSGEWDRPPMELSKDNQKIAPVINRIPTVEPKKGNASFVSARVLNPKVIQGVAAHVVATVKNNSDMPLALRVNMENSNGTAQAISLNLNANAREDVSFNFTPNETGVHWVSLKIEGDGDDNDNLALLSILSTKGKNVLFVGEKRSFGLLPFAISPRGDGSITSLIPKYTNLSSFSRELMLVKPSLVVLRWKDLTASNFDSRALEVFIREGGNSIVVPDPQKPEVGRLPRWLNVKSLKEEKTESATVLSVLERKSDLWGALRGSNGQAMVRRFTANRFMNLEIESDYKFLIGKSFRKPVMAYTKLGEGTLLLSGIPFVDTWSSFATDPSGVALVVSHNMALVGTGSEVIKLTAGELLPPIQTEAKTVEVVSMMGDALALTTTPTDLPSFARVGVYLIKTPEATYPITVSAAAEETISNFITDDEISILKNSEYTMQDTSLDNLNVDIKAQRAGTSFYVFFLILAMIAWAVEAILGSSKGKSRTVDPHKSAVEKAGKEGA
jgi:hypothetical protein